MDELSAIALSNDIADDKTIIFTRRLHRI